MPAEVTDWLSALAAVVAAGAAIIAVVVAKWQLQNAVVQLRKVQEGLRVDGFMAILQLECEINSRKQVLHEVSFRIAEFTVRKTKPPRVLEALDQRLKASIENYLNAVDRLAFCILKDYVPERDWAAEYRDALANDIRTYKDCFQADSRFRNILDLHNKWQRS